MGLSSKFRAFNAMRKMDNGWQLITDRLLYPGEPVQYCRYKGLEFITDLAGGDATGAREILTSDEYKRFLPQMDLSGQLKVLDLGGNNGGFPLLLAAEGFEIEKVLSVELNPHTASRLRFNLENNLGDKASILNAAVCGSEREVHIADTRGGTSENIYDGSTGAGSVTVPGITFDGLVEGSFGDDDVDLCKIDVEGAEFEILHGDTCSRLAQCRNVLIEIHHTEATPRDIAVKRFLDLGFREENEEAETDRVHRVHFFRRVHP